MTTQPTSTPVQLRRHRLHHFAGRAHEVLDDVGEPVVWAMSTVEITETLAELESLKDRITARQLELVSHADRVDLAKDADCTTTAAWVRSVTGLTGTTAAGTVKRARVLANHRAVAAALNAVTLRVEQASVITAAVDALPAEVANRRDLAARHLLEAARDHDAKALTTLGAHLLEVVAPDRADAILAEKLEAEEAEAQQCAYLQTWSDGHGSRYLKAKIPDLHAAMLDAALEAIANPTRPEPIPREGISTAQVRGQALCELIERYPVKKLPRSGGVHASVVVTMTIETLMGGLTAAGVLGTEVEISPSQARQLAAKAGVIPVVLGGPSRVLDLGRRRGFTPPQRLAMAIRQGGVCNIDGCERPATWCDANHRTPYAKTGRTTLDNGELICPRHHTLVHQGHDYPRRT